MINGADPQVDQAIAEAKETLGRLKRANKQHGLAYYDYFIRNLNSNSTQSTIDRSLRECKSQIDTSQNSNKDSVKTNYEEFKACIDTLREKLPRGVPLTPPRTDGYTPSYQQVINSAINDDTGQIIHKSHKRKRRCTLV